jgi:aspartate aminotransferase-like enzyme
MLMKYRLYTPGPTSVPEMTLLQLAKPVTHHRTAEFRKIFSELQTLLQYVFQTKENVYTITGSGTAAFEAAFTSTVPAGGKVLNITNGKFAERWASYGKAFGCDLKELKIPYGEHVTAEQVDAELQTAKGAGGYAAVTLVHSETSTGTTCDLAAIAKAVRKHEDVLLIVDSITGIGALPFKMDEWGVDVAITGSQKSLMLPPGLGYVALSQRAQAMLGKANQKNFYFDLQKYKKSITDSDTPFTPANTLIEAQLTSLRMIKDETIEGVWKRTAGGAAAFRAGMKALGFAMFSKTPADSVTAVRYMDGVSDKDFRGTLKNSHNIHVAGGQGTMESQIFRVNHMGYTDIYDNLVVVAAIEHTLKKLGKPVQFGAGVAAVQNELVKLF